MADDKFRYETHQTLPATLTDEERASLRQTALGLRSTLGKRLAWIITTLSFGLLIWHA